MERIVVCFRWRSAAKRSDVDDPSLAASDALLSRAAALGGRVIAWHVRSFAFDFSPDALEDAIDLVVDGRPGALAGFGVGIGLGEIEDVSQGDSRIALGRGPALRRAMALSQIARDGEVLVEPGFEPVRSERLLCSGSRLGVFGRERVRGLSLDLRFPWRSDGPDALGRLSFPQRIGGPSPNQLVSRPGELSVVRARRGAGGSRFLAEVGQRHGAHRHLLVVPNAAGEPLGALSATLQRARDHGAAPSLSAEHRASLDSLLAGEGLEIEASSGLLAEWFAKGESGLVLIDEPHDIDADTLETVARAATSLQFAVVTRVLASEQLPPALLQLGRASELALDALGRAPSSELARAISGGALDDRAATRWGKRGGGWPLAIVEALLESTESAELVWQGEQLVPRLRIAGRGHTRSARHWIERRLRFVPREGRRVLEALALLGGCADENSLARLVKSSGSAAPDVAATARTLEEARWLHADGDQSWALPSATHRVELLALLEPEQKRRLHAEVSRLLGESERPLAVCSAALHAVLAGESDRAAMLGSRAAAVARAVGLGETADALERFAGQGALDALGSRALGGVFRAELGQQLTSVAEPTPSTRSEPPERRAELLAAMSSDPERTPTSAVAQALKAGNLDEVERIVSQLRDDGEHALLADRLEAMAALARGQTSHALRLLRSAKDRAHRLGPVERCRAALAHGIGLARAGRSTEALLETLEGLAHAREAGDIAGERACARFLAQLSRSAGQEAPAAAWDALARAPS